MSASQKESVFEYPSNMRPTIISSVQDLGFQRIDVPHQGVFYDVWQTYFRETPLIKSSFFQAPEVVEERRALKLPTIVLLENDGKQYYQVSYAEEFGKIILILDTQPEGVVGGITRYDIQHCFVEGKDTRLLDLLSFAQDPSHRFSFTFGGTKIETGYLGILFCIPISPDPTNEQSLIWRTDLAAYSLLHEIGHDHLMDPHTQAIYRGQSAENVVVNERQATTIALAFIHSIPQSHPGFFDPDHAKLFFEWALRSYDSPDHLASSARRRQQLKEL